jgi:hypothetical protein
VQVVEVAHLPQGVVEAPKDEQLVLVEHHTVAGAGAGAALQAELLPDVGGEVQSPQILKTDGGTGFLAGGGNTMRHDKEGRTCGFGQ